MYQKLLCGIPCGSRWVGGFSISFYLHRKIHITDIKTIIKVYPLCSFLSRDIYPVIVGFSIYLHSEDIILVCTCILNQDIIFFVISSVKISKLSNKKIT